MDADSRFFVLSHGGDIVQELRLVDCKLTNRDVQKLVKGINGRKVTVNVLDL